MKTLRNKTGFTVVEVLIIISIIGLLAAIAIPSFMKKKELLSKPEISNEQMLANYKVEFVFEIEGAKVYRFWNAFVNEYQFLAIPKTPVILERVDSPK